LSGALKVTQEEAAKLISSRAKSRGKSPTVGNLTLVPASVVPVVEPDVVLVPYDVVVEHEHERRPLADIEQDLAPLVKARRRNVFKEGALLIEAKAQVSHGDWLPWLQEHFMASESTAQNYMSAARYLVKNPTVGDLKLSPAAIYWLANPPGGSKASETPTDVYQDACRAVSPLILEVAKTAYVDKEYCDEAVAGYLRKQSAARARATRAERAEAKANPPEPVPPTPRVISQDPEREARRQLRATMTSAELLAHDRKQALHGQLNGSVKVICRLIPNLADLFDSSIDNGKLIEATAVLLAVVAAREAIARGDDPRSAGEYLAAALLAAGVGPNPEAAT
jgi:hypothetical protein